MATLSADFTLPLRSFELELALEVAGTVALVGPSGAGKTSVLRAIAGLVRPPRGRIALGEDVWLDSTRRIFRKPDERRVGLVFQEYALFPHLTVRQNVAFAGRERAGEYLERFRISHLAGARPDALSGGERQRVALARALAADPEVVLLDEPFAALDEITRRVLADDVLALWAAARPAIVFVTHNVEEAVYMASRVVVMSRGPGRIAGDFAVAGPMPRPPHFRTEPAFRATAEAVSAAIAEGIGA
jgi:NitT/TauT family transport system ATP-binding protein